MVENVKPQVSEAVVRYQARTKLLELALDIASKRVINWSKVEKAADIRLWLKALDYSAYLSTVQRNQIMYKLIQISGVNDFPTAPVLEERDRPAILVGEQGPPGTDGASGTGGGTPFSNTDVDTPSEVVDSFALSLGNGVKWEYTIFSNSGSNLRKGSISAGWLTDGSQIAYGADASTAEIGDTDDVQLSADISGGNVRLIATTASNNWTVKGTRLING